MTELARIMLGVFITAWCVGVIANIYAARYFLAMWFAGFDRRPSHAGYWKKTLLGWGVALVAVATGFAAGGVAEYGGRGWGN